MSILRKIRTLSNKIFPPYFFKLLRQTYANFKRVQLRTITEDEFRKLLVEKMKIEKGSTLFIHSSLGYLKLDFSAGALINILQEIVGPTGNLLFPSTHFTERAEDYLRRGGVFDVKRSVSIYGMLTELARRHKNAKRSLHPTSSVIAIGPDAEYLLNEHHVSVYPLGEKSPYFKMLKFNSFVIGLGITSEYLSFSHCPEDVYPEKFSSIKPRMDEIFEAKVIDINKNELIVRTLAASKSIKNRNVPGYVKKYIGKEIGQDFTFHGSDFFCFKAQPLFSAMVELADKGINIYNF